jgi:hypothetical protein
MSERPPQRRAHTAFLTLGALFGTLPLAVLAGIGLARLLPLEEPLRVTLGFTLVIPLWVLAMTVAFLGRSAARAWALCIAASVVLGAAAFGGPSTTAAEKELR